MLGFLPLPFFLSCLCSFRGLSMPFPCTCAVNCALLGYYAASSGNFLPTFRDNLSVPPPRVIVKGQEPLKMWPIGCPETSVRNCHYSLRNNPKVRSSNLLRGGKQKSHKIGYICRYDKHILVQYVDGTLHNNRYCLRHRVLLPSGSERLWDPPNAVSQTVPLTYSIKSSMSSVQCSLF